MRAPRRGLRQPDLGELGVGIGDPGHGPGLDLGRQAEQRVLDHHHGVMAGHVGERVGADHVAGGEHPAVGGAQPGVDLDAAGAMSDPGGRQPQVLDHRAAPGGEQQRRALDPFRSTAAFDRHRDALSGRLDPGDPGALADVEPVGAQTVAQDVDQLGIVLGHNLGLLEHRDPRAQAAERLAQLAADRAAADDDQVAWQRAQPEHRLVGQIGRGLEAGYGRHQGRRAGRDHEAPRRNPGRPGLELAGAGEPAALAQHRHPHALETLDRILGRDAGDHAVDVVVHRLEIDLRGLRAQAERAGVAVGDGGLGAGEQGLGRHAAGVQAVAAHRAGLDQHGSRSQQRRAGGDRKTGRTGAQDADVGVDGCGQVGRPLADDPLPMTHCG